MPGEPDGAETGRCFPKVNAEEEEEEEAREGAPIASMKGKKRAVAQFPTVAALCRDRSLRETSMVPVS